ncbi:MAG TPA: IS4 family transposase [Thermoplasmata archaeon]|nr:IS4 family transposase [Thermoplasmata archaeon]
MPRHPPPPVRPTPLRRGEVEHALNLLLPSELIERFARETGFVRRERTIRPVAFLWTLILDFGVELHRHLEELRAGYAERTELPLTYPGFYLRFTPELSKFLKRCLEHALAELAHEPGRELDPKLARFEDLLLKDSSVVRLHASLAKRWPATRSRKIAAGVKVDLLVSVRANGPKTVALVGERTHDAKLLRVGAWVKDRLLLFDLGYYSHRLFAKIGENGGFFVSRWKKSADPLFVRSLTVHRGRAIDLEGKRLSEVLPRLERQTLDAEVELAFRRRTYNGQRSGDTLRCRLVAVWDEAGSEYHLYLTNVGPEVLSAEEVARLYAMRWEIELVFKELKSHYALDQFRTTNAQVVEALIWSALLTLVVSRRLHTLVRRRAPEEIRSRYTQLRFAVNFRRGARHLLSAMLYDLGLSKERGNRFALNMYLVEASLDPHVKRHRFREEWSR